MKTNERNIQMTDNRLAGGTALVAMILIAMMILAFTWVRPAFAAEENQSVTITIKAGDHGSVNGRTGEFSENISTGESLKISIECEEGYLIGRVLLNDEPLAADDLKELLGTTIGGLDLEELDTDLTVEIIFMTTSEYEIQKEYGQVADDLRGDDTADGEDSQQEQDESKDNESSDVNTEPTGDDTTDTPKDSPIDSEDNGAVDNGTDIGDNALENQDGQNDITEAKDGVGTENNTDKSTSDDSGESSKNTDTSADNDEGSTSDEESTTNSADNDNTETIDPSSDTANNGTTETETKATGTQNETTENSDTTTTNSAKDDSDSTDDGKGDYYDTPKTGDERNQYIWLAVCIGGLIMTAISAGSLIRRTFRDRNGRWSE